MIMMTPPGVPGPQAKADALEHAMLVMDELVDANDGDAQRAIGLVMLASAIKGGDTTIAFMRRFLDEIGRESAEDLKGSMLQDRPIENRQQRRARERGKGRS